MKWPLPTIYNLHRMEFECTAAITHVLAELKILSLRLAATYSRTAPFFFLWILIRQGCSQCGWIFCFLFIIRNARAKICKVIWTSFAVHFRWDKGVCSGSIWCEGSEYSTYTTVSWSQAACWYLRIHKEFVAPNKFQVFSLKCMTNCFLW